MYNIQSKGAVCDSSNRDNKISVTSLACSCKFCSLAWTCHVGWVSKLLPGCVFDRATSSGLLRRREHFSRCPWAFGFVPSTWMFWSSRLTMFHVTSSKDRYRNFATQRNSSKAKPFQPEALTILQGGFFADAVALQVAHAAGEAARGKILKHDSCCFSPGDATSCSSSCRTGRLLPLGAGAT